MFNKAIVIGMMLLLMNYCVMYNDTGNGGFQSDGAYTSFNEIESVFELITEEWMDIENCVPESENEDDPEDAGKVKEPFKYFSFHHVVNVLPDISARHIVSYDEQVPNCPQQGVITPPPDFA